MYWYCSYDHGCLKELVLVLVNIKYPRMHIKLLQYTVDSS